MEIDGYKYEYDIDEYEYYLLANFAIRKRMRFNQYGDATVFSNIQKELERIEKIRTHKKAKSQICGIAPLYALLDDDYSCGILCDKTKSGMTIRAKRLPKGYVKKPLRACLCDTEYGICRLIDSESVRAKPVRKSKKYDFVGVRFEPQGTLYSYLRGDIDVAVGDKVIIDAKGEENEVEVASVFTSPAEDMPLDIGRFKKVIRIVE